MRATIFLFVGLLVGAGLGGAAVSCATASSAAPAPTSELRAYRGSCEQTGFTADELRALVSAQLGYSAGDSPKETRVVFRRRAEHANLELFEDGHFDDSVRGVSGSFELRYRADRWVVESCARELRCYRGQSADGRCN